MLVIGTGDTLQGVAGTASAVTVTVTGVSVNNSTGAETFGKLYQGQLPNAAGVLFTVPAGVSWIIKTLMLSNSTGGSVSGVQLFLSGAAGTNSLVGPFAFGAGFTATFSENGWSVIDNSGNIQTSGGGGGGGITQLTSDVTAGPGSGSQVATITAHAVTYAKIQNVSANSKLLGSGAAGGGSSPAEITLGTGLSMSGTTLNAAASGELLNIQTITSTGSGTYTPTSGTNSVIIELQGGGGGGAGCASPGGTNTNLSTPGGGGGWLKQRLTANFSGASYVVGALGAGGASGANNGVNGSDTTFTTTGGSPVTYTAQGGPGGTHLGPFAAPWLAFNSATPATPTQGFVNRPGGNGNWCYAVNTANTVGANSGASMYSAGTVNIYCSTNASAAGIAATGYGGGGGGAIAEGTGGAAAGGNGSNGLIIIYEYS